MKNIFVLLSFAALLASCGGAGSDELRRQITDSMNVEAKKRGIDLSMPATSSKFSMRASQKGQNNLPIDSFYMYTSVADTYIQNWHRFVKQSKNPTLMADSTRFSFIIPASNFQYLINTMGCSNVVFYIGMNNAPIPQLTLLYVGANYLPDNPDTLTEVPIQPGAPYGPNDKFILDNSWPCPTCARIGIHSYGKPWHQSFTITPQAGVGGSISPSSPQQVGFGGITTFSITPNTNHHIEDVKVNGVSKGPLQQITLSNVTYNYTVEASFATGAATYTVTPVLAEAGTGTISPSSPMVVADGATPTFTFTRSNPNYVVSYVKVNGVKLPNSYGMASYTLPPVHKNTTIEVTFAIN